MANTNMNRAKKAVAELELEAQLIPSETNPNNCKYIIVNGTKLKTSQWNYRTIKETLENIKDGCSCTNITVSNKGNVEDLIPLNCPLSETIREYIKLQVNSDNNTKEAWMNSVIDFYCLDDNNNYNGKIEEAKKVVLNLINKKDIVIYNDYVFNRVGIEEVITKYNRFNSTDIDVKSNTNLILERLSK